MAREMEKAEAEKKKEREKAGSVRNGSDDGGGHDDGGGRDSNNGGGGGGRDCNNGGCGDGGGGGGYFTYTIKKRKYLHISNSSKPQVGTPECKASKSAENGVANTAIEVTAVSLQQSTEIPGSSARENLKDRGGNRCIRRLRDTLVQPNMSPDSTTYIGDDLSAQKIKRQVSFIFVKNNFVCLKCLKKFRGVSLFRKHVWWHIHGSMMKGYLCPFCTPLTEKSKCPTVNKMIRLLVSSASESAATKATSDQQSPCVGDSVNVPQNINTSLEPPSLHPYDDESGTYYNWENGKFHSKQTTSPSSVEKDSTERQNNGWSERGNDIKCKPVERILPTMNVTDDTPLNLSINNNTHKTNDPFSDSKSPPVHPNLESSEATKVCYQNPYLLSSEIDKNQLIFGGSHGVYYCENCNSLYESTKSFYAHISWHFDNQLEICPPCMDNCDCLDGPVENRADRTCCVMAYVIGRLSEKGAGKKKQVKVCWKSTEKCNMIFIVTLEGGASHPAEVSQLISDEANSGYTIRKLLLPNNTSSPPQQLSSSSSSPPLPPPPLPQEHPPPSLSDYPRSSLVVSSSPNTHTDETPNSNKKRKSKGVITVILYQNLYECLNCKKEMTSQQQLTSHLMLHLHSEERLCPHRTCPSSQSCPVLSRILPCLPFWDNDCNTQIPFIISWETASCDKTNFFVHFMSRSVRSSICDDDEYQQQQQQQLLQGGSCSDVDSTDTVQQRDDNSDNVFVPRTLSFTCSVSSGLAAPGVIGLAVEEDEQQQLLSLPHHNRCTHRQQQHGAKEKWRVPEEPGFEKMTFVCRSDQYICLNCAKHFALLDHFKRHILWHFHELNRLCSQCEERTFTCPILKNIMRCLPNIQAMDKTVEIHWRKGPVGKTTFKVQTYLNHSTKPSEQDPGTCMSPSPPSPPNLMQAVDKAYKKSAAAANDGSGGARNVHPRRHSLPPPPPLYRHRRTYSAAAAIDCNIAPAVPSTSPPPSTETTENNNNIRTSPLSLTTAEPTDCDEPPVLSPALTLTERSPLDARTSPSLNTDAGVGLHGDLSHPVLTDAAGEAAAATGSNNSSSNSSNIANEPTLSPRSTRSSAKLAAAACNPKPATEPSTGGFYVCGLSDCKFSSLTAEPFNKHISQVHSDATRYPCAHCGVGAPTREKLSKHMSVHAANKMFLLYQCNIAGCNYGTNLRAEFSNHLQCHHPLKSVYVCRYCKESLADYPSLMQHLESNVLKLIHCPHCSAKDKSRPRILNHIRLKHSDKPRQIVVSTQILCAERKNKQVADTEQRGHHHSDDNSNGGSGSSSARASEQLSSTRKENDAMPNSNLSRSNQYQVDFSDDDESPSHEPLYTNHSLSSEGESEDTSHNLTHTWHKKRGSAQLPEESVWDFVDEDRREAHLALSEMTLPSYAELLSSLGKNSAALSKDNIERLKVEAARKRKLKIVLERVDNSDTVRCEAGDKPSPLADSHEMPMPTLPPLTPLPHKERNVFQLFNEIEQHNNNNNNNSSSASTSTPLKGEVTPATQGLPVPPPPPVTENGVTQLSDDGKMATITTTPTPTPLTTTEESASISTINTTTTNTTTTTINTNTTTNINTTSSSGDGPVQETWFHEISLGGPMLNSRLETCFSIEQGKYKCHVCPAVLNTVYKIHLHLLSDHFRWPLWNCMDCGIRFYSLSKIRSHCWRRHKFKEHNIKPLPLPTIVTGADGKPCVENMPCTKPSRDSEKKKNL
ncbi:hypothetical protein Ahia01_001087600, partial [Argonauta hians]